MSGSREEFMGHPAEPLGDLYIITPRERISARTAEQIAQRWKDIFGDTKRLLILDGGMTLTAFPEPLATPIFDALVAEFSTEVAG